MTSIPEPECSIILDAANVRRKINDYKIQTATVAQIFSTPGFDMANMLYSDEEWLLLHPIIDADGNALPATDRLPSRPDPSKMTRQMRLLHSTCIGSRFLTPQ